MKTNIKLIKSVANILGLQKSDLPICNNILVSETGYQFNNLETSVFLDAETGAKQPFLIDSKEFINVNEALITPTMEISTDASSVTFMAGKQKVSFNGLMSVDEFPLASENHDSFKLDSVIAGLNRIDLANLQTASGFISSDWLRPAMTMIYFSKDNQEMAATNAHKLYWKGIKALIREDFFVSKDVVKLIKAIAPESVNIYKIGDILCYDFNGGHIITKQFDGKFPDYKGVIPLSVLHTVSVNKKEILAALTQAGKFANKTSKRVVFYANGILNLSANDVDYKRDFSMEIPCEMDHKSEVKEITIGFNYEILSDCIAACESDTICLELSSPNRAGVINCEALCMPVGLNN